jgi:hypothetical protein
MVTRSLLVLASSLLLCASAADAAPGPAAPAGENEAPSNVSTIDGQPVKVGERNEYLAAYKKSNLAVDPLGPFLGLYDGAYAYGVTPQVAIAGSIAYFSTGHSTYGWNIFQITASVPLYLRRTFSGPYLEPGIVYRSVNHQSIDSGSNYGYDETWAGPELLLGWQWGSVSGLNVALAAGAAQHWGGTHRSAMDTHSVSNDPDVNGYFRIGYGF